MIDWTLRVFLIVRLVIPIWIMVAGSGSGAEPASNAAEVATFVKGLYSTTPLTTPEQYFDPPMVALMNENARLTPKGDEGALDSDPFCDCQDNDGMQTQVIVRSVSPERATVEAKLIFGGNAQYRSDRVVYYLVKTNREWRIHDMSSRSIPSLVQLFVSANEGAH